MKQLRLTLVVLFLLAMFIGISCSDKSSNSSDVIPTQLVGTWWFSSATDNGNALSYADLRHTETGITSSQTINANGTWSFAEYDAVYDTVLTQSGTLVVDGNEFTLTVEIYDGDPVSPPDPINYIYGVLGNTLTITTQVTVGSETHTIVVVNFKY